MTNKLISALALFVFLYSSTGYAQIEELEPTIELETENPDAATTVADHTPDFDDTWRTPFVSDEMTRDPEQNKSWRLGEYKYNAKPKSSLEFGLHGGHYFIDGDVDRLIPGGWGAGFHLRRSINYTFSLRGSALYSVAYGQESQPWYHENVDWGNEPG